MNELSASAARSSTNDQLSTSVPASFRLAADSRSMPHVFDNATRARSHSSLGSQPARINETAQMTAKQRLMAIPQLSKGVEAQDTALPAARERRNEGRLLSTGSVGARTICQLTRRAVTPGGVESSHGAGRSKVRRLFPRGSRQARRPCRLDSDPAEDG